MGQVLFWSSTTRRILSSFWWYVSQTSHNYDHDVMILYWKLKESTFPCLILDLDIIFGNKSFQTTLQRNSCHFMSIKSRSWRIIMKETRTFSNLWRREKHCLRQWRNLRWFPLNNRYYLLMWNLGNINNWIVNKLDILFIILSKEFVAKFFC